MDFPDLKQQFHAQCETMDPVKDTFSKVLERTGLAGGDGLKRGELDTLNGIYLEAARRGIQEKARPEPPGGDARERGRR